MEKHILVRKKEVFSMRISDAEVCGVAVLETQRSAHEFLKDCTTKAGFGAIASLLTRDGVLAPLMEAERQVRLREVHMQSQALYIGLAPIWLKLGRKLPLVDQEDISQVFSLKQRGQWSETTVYNAIAAANGLWSAMVGTYKDEFAEADSSIYVAAIIQAFLNKLEPLEAAVANAALLKS
jgi:hypothetical protein